MVRFTHPTLFRTTLPAKSIMPDDAQISPADDSRLVVLEERLMFQQRQIDELSGVVLDHRRELDALAAELAQCRTALERIAAAGEAGDLPHEKPPHY